MTIATTDLAPVPEDLARRILVTARSIAPCLDTLEGEPREDAIAILKGVGAGGGRSHLIKRQWAGPAGVEYNAGSWWSDDDRAGLRALCAATSDDTAGHPIGEFPATSKALTRMWPEDC